MGYSVESPALLCGQDVFRRKEGREVTNGAVVATPPLRRTAVALGILAAVDVGIMGEMGGGVLSFFVALIGAVLLVPAALWSGLRGSPVLARNRALRAGMYLLLGAVALGAVRFRAQPLNEFRSGLTPGMSVLEVLRRLDALYQEHPRRWTYITGWGTTREFDLKDADQAARTPDTLPGFRWYAGTARTPQDLQVQAQTLSKARQVWFTLRTGVGYLHFFVSLDETGRVRSVSALTGHQA
jgi:hypothetical protein